jgi:cation:H+ antiporter
MAPLIALPLFAVSLVVTLRAASTFARRLDQLGAKFGMPEVLIGLLTALAADGPEVSSALAALSNGAHEAGVGVIVGSNAFNLAAMVGLSAMLAGRVRVGRETLILEGSAGLAVTAIGMALLLGALSAILAVVLLACVLVPYLTLVIAGPRLATRVHMPRLVDRVIEGAVEEGEHPRSPHSGIHFATHRQVALMALDVLLIVLGSVGMVQAALSLGDRWGIGPALIGALVLGPLTSLPNAMTGVRLGLANRGAALVTEALNSNTINLVAGVAIPSLFVTLTAHSTTDRLDLALLAAMTVATVALLRASNGMRRRGGVAVVALYALFVAIQLLAA